MKKIYVLVIITVLVFSACGQKTSNGDTAATGAEKTETDSNNDIGLQNPDQSGQIAAGAHSDEESVPREPVGGEIIVSCYDAGLHKPFLEYAAHIFELANPAAKINIEAATPDPIIKEFENGGGISDIFTFNNPQAEEEYIQRTGTLLMLGKGADVYVLDVLPLYRYIPAGTFEDLRDYMSADADFDITNYRENIFDALTVNEKLYVLPMDYTFKCFAFNPLFFTESEQTQLSSFDKVSIDALIDLAGDAYNRQTGAKYHLFKLRDDFSYISYFSNVFDADYLGYVDVVNKKLNLAGVGGLFDIIDTGKKYAAAGYIQRSVRNAAINANANANAGVFEGVEDISYDDIFFYDMLDATRLLDLFCLQLSSDTPDIDTIRKVFPTALTGIRCGTDGAVPFMYSFGLGINANSPNKQLGWELLKFLLTDEMQIAYIEQETVMSTQNKNKGLPVSKSAFSEKTKADISTKAAQEKQQALFNDYTSRVDKYTAYINTYIYRDAIVDEAIHSVLSDYITGKKTAEEAARSLQSKVTLYLNE